MMNTRRLVTTLACLSVAACGTTGSTPPVEPTSSYSYGTSSSSRAAYDSGRGGRRMEATSTTPAGRQPAPGLTAPPAAGASSDGYGYHASRDAAPRGEAVEDEKPREERPGLGTSFGETRASQVHDVPFERAGDSPFSVASLYYNDRGGVEAMASYDARRAGRLDAAVPMRGGLTVSVIDESGSPLEAMSVGGRVYVLGESGRRYSLILHNRTERRYEAVVSVDGLDVVDGQPAATSKRGYLIEPWASVTIDGFRRNYEEVAAFRFGSVSSSYAAKTSGDRNVGVIGFAFFGEKGVPVWSDDEIERRHTAEPFSDLRFAQPPR